MAELTRDKLALVSGFLSPAMVERDERGRMLNGFSDPRDVERISKGYACGNCCATFHTFQLDCPICFMPTHVASQRSAAPDLWQSHVDQRHADIPTLGPGKREPLPAQPSGPRTPDEFFAAVGKDTDIDTVPLSKLKPSKFGRGRG